MQTPPLDAIDTLFLDAGNTLVGMDLSLACEWLAGRGLRLDLDAVERAEAAARPLLSRHLAAGRSSESRDSFALHVANTLRGCGGPPSKELAALAHQLATHLKVEVGTRRLWSRVLPGVPEALAALRAAGVKLAVVSNSDGTIEQGLERVGLREHLDAVVDSARVGFEKPDPRIFVHALEATASLPARSAHVGDLHAVDVVGARAAGVHGILVDPWDDWRDADCRRTPGVARLAAEICAARRARYSSAP